MKTDWIIINTPEMEKQREEERASNFKETVDSMSDEDLRKLAIKQDSELYCKQQEIYSLGNIASSAHWYLSEPKLAKRDLINSLVRNGFWIPRIKRFKTKHVLNVDEYFYWISAGNAIGETKVFGPLIKIKESISFTAWIDDRIPVKYWMIYQSPMFGDLKEGKCVMKIPYQDPVDGIFELNLIGARDFNNDIIFMFANNSDYHGNG